MNYLRRLKNSALPILSVAFLLGFFEGVMIYYDRLLGLGGVAWFAGNLGMVYLLFFGLPVWGVTGIFSESVRTRIYWAYAGLLTVFGATRYYRIFYGKLVDWPVRIALLACLLALVFGSLMTTRKRRWLAVLPLGIGIGYFSILIFFTAPDPTISAGDPVKRPNIIWITADTMRSDHLAQYGSNEDVFRQFDRWADDFVRFKNSYSTSSWTAPSVASMLTSLYPLQHGKSRGSVMNPNVVALPQILKRAGYSTHAISNQPLVSPGWGFGKGFDRFYSTSTVFMESTLIDILNEVWLEEDMVDITSDFNWVYDRFHTTKQTPSGLWGSYQDLMTRIDTDSPQFHFLYFFDPHSPYNPDPKWYPEGTELFEQTKYFYQNESLKPEGKPSGNTMGDIRRRYHGEINDVGDKVVRILSYLKEQEMYEDSLIIFTSDHGEKFYDHEEWLHGGPLYQSVTRVPLFIKFPNEKYAGKTIDRPIDNTNLVPTILNELGYPVQLDYQIAGQPLLVDGEVNPKLSDPMMQRLDWNNPSNFHTATIDQNRKIFYHSENGKVEMETFTLIGPRKMSRQPSSEIPDALEKGIAKRVNSHQNFLFAPLKADQSHEEQLKALGYIE